VPAPRAATLVLVVLCTAAIGAAAQAYRDELAAPPFALMQAMLQQLSESDPTPRMAEPVAVLEPLIRALSEKGSMDLMERLSQAIAKGDRATAYSSICLLVLLDAQDLVERISHTELDGWHGATVLLRKATLDLELISPALAKANPQLYTATVADLTKLARVLRDVDLTTAPDRIETLKHPLVEDLIKLRHAAARAGNGLQGGRQ
jgi:hypothetical protein